MYDYRLEQTQNACHGYTWRQAVKKHEKSCFHMKLEKAIRDSKEIPKEGGKK